MEKKSKSVKYFVRALMDAPIKRLAIENPMSVIIVQIQEITTTK